mmetsp:Transcript_38238/g.79746  ORF Transcript_38238/g.79746 Transcript_38238/m.79746 type:complete len:210 (-) Transcript_38238:1-630(-)|eukprot:s7408_g4.t1
MGVSHEISEALAGRPNVRCGSAFLDASGQPLKEGLHWGLQKDICQKYHVTNGLHDLAFGIPEWRHYKSEWLAGRRSAPLEHLPAQDYKVLLQARKHFLKAREQLLMHGYRPPVDGRKKLSKDAARFLSTVPTPPAKEIDAGLGLVDRVVEQQKSAEFEDWAKAVDYPSRRRQMLTLQEIQSLARNLAEMSRTCGEKAERQGLTDLRARS